MIDNSAPASAAIASATVLPSNEGACFTKRLTFVVFVFEPYVAVISTSASPAATGFKIVFEPSVSNETTEVLFDF